MAVISGTACLAAVLNYNLRVDKLIEKHNGFALGFATRFSSGRLMIIWPFMHHIDKQHRNYPSALNQELDALRSQLFIMIASVAIFDIIVVVVMLSRATS